MSVNNEHEMLEPEQELKNVGLKATAPRMRILELFQKAQEAGAVRHLTAEDIYKQLVAENIEVGLATVYRVLTQFEAAGQLRNGRWRTSRSHCLHALRPRRRVC